MILLEELVKHQIIKEGQVPDIIQVAEDKYNGDIDQALLDFSLDESKILEIKGQIYNIPTKSLDPNSVLSTTLNLIPPGAVQPVLRKMLLKLELLTQIMFRLLMF